MKKLLLAAALCISANVSAGSLVCAGTVEEVAYHGNDKLMVKLSSMNLPVFFCNPNSQWTVPGAEGRVMNSETCKAVFSMFLAARSSGQPLNRVHFDGDSVPESCTDFTGFSQVFVRYVNY